MDTCRQSKDLRIRIAVWPDGSWAVLEQSYDTESGDLLQDDDLAAEDRMHLDWQDGWEFKWIVVSGDDIPARLEDA